MRPGGQQGPQDPNADIVGWWGWYCGDTPFPSSVRSIGVFQDALARCEPLRLLCEPGLAEPRWQHGLAFALLTLWVDDPPSRSFHTPRPLGAVAYLVQQIVKPEGHYWAAAYTVLRHFFPDEFSQIPTSHEWIRLLQAGGYDPGDSAALARRYVRDALEIVESSPRPVQESHG